MQKIRSIIFIAILSCVSVLNAGELQFDKSGFGYASGVVETKNTVTRLYSKAKRWAATEFVDSRSAIQLDDQAAGEIIIKGSAKLSGINFFMNDEFMGSVLFDLSIKMKDGKFKYDITRLQKTCYACGPEDYISITSSAPSGKFPKSAWLKILAEVDLKITRVVSSLNDALQSEDNQDQW